MYTVPFVRRLYQRGSLPALIVWEGLWRWFAIEKADTQYPHDLARMRVWMRCLGLNPAGNGVTYNIAQNVRYAGLTDLLNCGLIQYSCSLRARQYGVSVEKGPAGIVYTISERGGPWREFHPRTDPPGTVGYDLHASYDFGPLPRRKVVGDAQVCLCPPDEFSAPPVPRQVIPAQLFGGLHPEWHSPLPLVALYGWLAYQMQCRPLPPDQPAIIEEFAGFRKITRADAGRTFDALLAKGVIRAI